MLLNQSLGTGAKYATNTNPAITADNTANSSIYSLRKVRPDYTGYACRIRRESDNAEADVSFNNANKVGMDSIVTLVADGSTQTLLTFTDGTSACGVEWYNQCKHVGSFTKEHTQLTNMIETKHFLNLSGDFTITLSGTMGSGNTSMISRIIAMEDSSTDRLIIENRNTGRGGYLKLYFNGTTITSSHGRITFQNGVETPCTFVISRSSSTLSFSVTVDGSTSTDTATDSSDLILSEPLTIGGQYRDNSYYMGGLVINTLTVVNSSGTTVFDITDTMGIRDLFTFSASVQPKLVTDNSLTENARGDVAWDFTSGNYYWTSTYFYPIMIDTTTGILAYAQNNSTSISNSSAVVAQYENSAYDGQFYLGLDSNGWSTVLTSSTDALGINAGGTSTATRPTIFGVGKPNSSSGTATLFRTDSTNGVYAEATDTYNQALGFALSYTNGGTLNVQRISYFSIGLMTEPTARYLDGYVSEVIILQSGSTDETRRAFNEQRNFWGF